MQRNTMVKKKLEFVAKHIQQGDKVIMIVPKEYHNSIMKLKNPMHVIVEEILE